jgi:hypothetical protein
MFNHNLNLITTPQQLASSYEDNVITPLSHGCRYGEFFNREYFNVYYITKFGRTVCGDVCWCTKFLLFQCLMFYISSNVDVHRLYHVLLRIHSLPEWNILMLGGQ